MSASQRKSGTTSRQANTLNRRPSPPPRRRQSSTATNPPSLTTITDRIITSGQLPEYPDPMPTADSILHYLTSRRELLQCVNDSAKFILAELKKAETERQEQQAEMMANAKGGRVSRIASGYENENAVTKELRARWEGWSDDERSLERTPDWALRVLAVVVLGDAGRVVRGRHLR